MKDSDYFFKVPLKLKRVGLFFYISPSFVLWEAQC